MWKEEQEATAIVHRRADDGFNQNYNDQDNERSGL